MPTQTRATLKGYFTKGSIPTENNFADLIDSTLVQIDDGLLTSATAPLSIKAVGADEGLINFYRIESGQNPNTTTWQIKHLPVGSSTPGLSIGTPAATRLFIDNTTGNVGIGTTAPVSRLDIFQAPRTDPGNHPKAVKGLYVTGDFGSASDGVEFRHSNGSQGIGFGFNSIYATGSNANQDLNLMPKGTGNVGIGTQTPGFPLTIGNNTLGDKISLWGQSGAHYGFGIQGSQLQIHTAGAGDDVVFGYGSSGSMTETMRIKGNGNVGIGTTTPGARLEVNGGAVISNGNGFAAKSNFMASGSLTIGGINVNYGGGKNWNTNTAALLFETSANTEIAVHDSGTRVASLMYYEGDAANRLTIGRDMGWGGLNQVIVSAPLQVTGSIISPMWKVTQVFERRSGPLPITSAPFLSSGGTLIVFFSGTAFKATGGIFSITVTVDTVLNYVDLYTNEGNSHKTFPSTFFVIRGIAAGMHTLTIAPFANGTLSDANDRYQATVLELPF